jgi:hypothetical protein
MRQCTRDRARLPNEGPLRVVAAYRVVGVAGSVNAVLRRAPRKVAGAPARDPLQKRRTQDKQPPKNPERFNASMH